MDWLIFCATNFNGSACPSESSSRSAPIRCAACIIQFSGTCPTSASWLPMLPLVVHYGPPDVRWVIVPCYNMSTYGHRAFSLAGPMAWNSITYSLRSIVVHWQFPSPAQNVFVFCQTLCIQHIRYFLPMHYILNLLNYSENTIQYSFIKSTTKRTNVQEMKRKI